MKEIGRLIIVLTSICIIAALALSQVDRFTRDRIAEALRAEKLDLVKAILPENDGIVSVMAPSGGNGGDPTPKTESGATEKEYFIAMKGGEVVGVAFEAVSLEGYAGKIVTMVGVDLDGVITGVRILEHKETPGLGSKITGEKFLALFIGRSLENTRWAVKKDGGDIDQITGATISPRAIVSSIYNELKNFADHREEIFSLAKAGNN